MEAQTKRRSLSAKVWGRAANMVLIPGGTFRMGSDAHYPDEAPAHRVHVDSFWIDKTPVTNRQFSTFVKVTGHVTFAELLPNPKDYPDILPNALHCGSLVFRPLGASADWHDRSQGWGFVRGADWRHPYGPKSSIAGLDDHPVVHIGYSDALIYARWTGKHLPTEAEWEFAARGGSEDAEYACDNTFAPNGVDMANTSQGKFPGQNSIAAGHPLTSSVEAFPPNGYGIHDMIGNIWEWTADWYSSKHNTDAANDRFIWHNPRGGLETESADPRRPHLSAPRKVIKGGPYICAGNYQRYRPAARLGQAVDTSTSDLGFRCVLREEFRP